MYAQFFQRHKVINKITPLQKFIRLFILVEDCGMIFCKISFNRLP